MRVWFISMVLQYLTGSKIILDVFRMYKDGASISHRLRRSLKMRVGCIRMVLQYLTG